MTLTKRLLTAAALATAATSAQAVTVSSDAFGAVPDNRTAGVTRTISIGTSGEIRDLNVSFDDFQSTWIGDIIVSLTSPLGTTVNLIDRPGVPNSFFGDATNLSGAYTFDDESLTDIAAAAFALNNGTIAPGTYAPDPSGGILSAFDGQDTFGIWSLNVSDNAGGDATSAGSATLAFEVAPVPLPASALLLLTGVGALGMRRLRR